MKFIEASVCLTQGHVWGDSLRATGWQTCRRCLRRRRDPWFVPPRRETELGNPYPRQRAHTRLRTIVVAARKGGAGKTTIAVHLALADHLRGRKVVLADADPQRSTTETMLGRVGVAPQQIVVGSLGVAAAHATAIAMNADRLVIDTPGGQAPTVPEAMALADLVVLVAQPTFLDVAAAVRTFSEARTIGVPALIVINRAPPARAGQEHASVAKTLEALRVTKLPAAATVVHARTLFQTSMASGRSVEELGASPAADEIAGLHAEVEAKLAEAAEARLAERVSEDFWTTRAPVKVARAEVSAEPEQVFP